MILCRENLQHSSRHSSRRIARLPATILLSIAIAIKLSAAINEPVIQHQHHHQQQQQLIRTEISRSFTRHCSPLLGFPADKLVLSLVILLMELMNKKTTDLVMKATVKFRIFGHLMSAAIVNAFPKIPMTIMTIVITPENRLSPCDDLFQKIE